MIDRTGTIETASAGLLRLLARERAEVEGTRLDDLLSGDLPALFQTLGASGFFDGRLESVESVDRYTFVDREGQVSSLCIEGLHWPHTGEDGAIRWMLSGAPIDEAEYETLCRERAGKGPASYTGLLVAALYAWLLSGSGAAFELGAAYVADTSAKLGNWCVAVARPGRGQAAHCRARC